MSFWLNFINSASHLVNLGNGSREEKNTAVEPLVSKEKSAAKDYTQMEIDTLERKFGPFKSGMTVEVELHQMLSLVPRSNRPRVDAYNKLSKELKKQGVDLVITSRKSHNNLNQKQNNYETF